MNVTDNDVNELYKNMTDQQENEINRYCLDIISFIRSSNLNKKKCKCIIKDVGYLSARFEYFRVPFVLQPIPTMVTLVPDRAQRALSIPLITFFFHCHLSP